MDCDASTRSVKTVSEQFIVPRAPPISVNSTHSFNWKALNYVLLSFLWSLGIHPVNALIRGSRAQKERRPVRFHQFQEWNWVKTRMRNGAAVNQCPWKRPQVRNQLVSRSFSKLTIQKFRIFGRAMRGERKVWWWVCLFFWSFLPITLSILPVNHRCLSIIHAL